MGSGADALAERFGHALLEALPRDPHVGAVGGYIDLQWFRDRRLLFASEADIKIPDLGQVKFNGLGGMEGGTLMYLGLAICVIGAGSGGLSVAAGAVQMGARVVLIEKGRMGGDCLNTGCVPSKALIHAARVAESVRRAGRFGVNGHEPAIDIAALRAHVQGVIAGIAAFPRQKDRLIAWGWVLLLSPLWVILFGVFGVAPIVTRPQEILPLLRNALGFIGGALAAYLIAQQTLGRSLKDRET